MNEDLGENKNPDRVRGPKWRWLLFALACIVTLVALAYAEENWRGHHAWSKYRRELQVKGEKIALSQLIPAPVPPDQNLALAPLLRPILDYTQGTGGIVWGDTKGLARLETFNTALPARDGTNLALGSLERGTFADLTAWSEHYRQNTNQSEAAIQAFQRRYGLAPNPIQTVIFPAAPPGASPAQIVLTALGKVGPELGELREAAASRRLCRFPVRYEDEPPAGILLPHLARVKGISTVVLVRATAELDAGKPAEALQDLELGLRLSEGISDEPLIISHLVRVAMLGNCLQTVREGLARHAWTDGQLVEIEARLAPVNLLAEYKLGMRGDRAGMVAELDYMRRHGSWGVDLTQFFGQQAITFERMIRFGPSGWTYQNMLSFSRYMQDHVLAAVDETSRRLFPEVSEEGTRALRACSGPYTMFSRVTQPGLERIIQRTGRMQTFVDATRLACALERYRLANGTLPDTLARLTPRFIERIPNDIIDGQPLRWKRTADGGYVLYSIGWNKKDDGGEVGWNRAEDTGVHGLLKEKPGPWVDPAMGDWVWEMAGRVARN